MRITFKQLKKCRVETVSGQFLGRVADVVIDTDTGLVTAYDVKPVLIGSTEYMIAHNQVVRFEEHKMVVQDTVTPVGGEAEDVAAGDVIGDAVVARVE